MARDKNFRRSQERKHSHRDQYGRNRARRDAKDHEQLFGRKQPVDKRTDIEEQLSAR